MFMLKEWQLSNDTFIAMTETQMRKPDQVNRFPDSAGHSLPSHAKYIRGLRTRKCVPSLFRRSGLGLRV